MHVLVYPLKMKVHEVYKKGSKKMSLLTEKETTEIYGGVAKSVIALGIMGLGVLIAGIIDGYFRPLKCNK